MEDKFKKTEKALYDYKVDKSYLEMYKMQFEVFKNDVQGINAISYEEKSCPTNKFNSNVENEVVVRSKAFDLYKEQINEYNIKIMTIDNALNILTEREKVIIERRYFDRAKNIDIAGELDLTEEYICDLKRGIVQRLSDIIFLGKY